jgi:hypothetical protein
MLMSGGSFIWPIPKKEWSRFVDWVMVTNSVGDASEFGNFVITLISCLSWIISLLIRDSSAVWRLLWICRSRGTSESYAYGKQRICFSNSGSAHFHVSWLSDSIFYQKPLYKSLHVPIIFLFIHNHLTLRKWCCTPLQHDFALDPMIPPFVFQFSNMCHVITRKPRLPQCIMGDDLHINKYLYCQHTRLLRQNNYHKI